MLCDMTLLILNVMQNFSIYSAFLVIEYQPIRRNLHWQKIMNLPHFDCGGCCCCGSIGCAGTCWELCCCGAPCGAWDGIFSVFASAEVGHWPCNLSSAARISFFTSSCADRLKYERGLWSLSWSRSRSCLNKGGSNNFFKVNHVITFIRMTSWNWLMQSLQFKDKTIYNH